MRIMFDLHTLKQRRAYMNIRAEIEERGRQDVESEVKRLREKISDLKVRSKFYLFKNEYIQFFHLGP